MDTMKKIIALILVLFATVSSAAPLQSWSQWVTDEPFTSKQIPPGALIMRGIGTDAYYVAEIDPTTGEIPVNATVNATIEIDYSGVTGAPVPAEAAFIGGEDPSGDLVGIAVDAAGNLQADVVSSALPTGAATEAKQDSGISLLTTIDADTSTIAGDTTSIDNKTPALGQALMAASVPVVIASNQTVTITGTDVDIRDLSSVTDSVSAVQSGTWNVGNITGTVSLPTGAATAANQATIISELQDIEAAIGAGNVVEVQNKVNLSYSSTNVTTSAYVEIVATTSGAITSMTSFEGSGQGMILATGAAAAEVDLLYIPPGGIDGQLNVSIPAGVRLSLKAITATASSGRFIANFMGP